MIPAAIFALFDVGVLAAVLPNRGIPAIEAGAAALVAAAWVVLFRGRVLLAGLMLGMFLLGLARGASAGDQPLSPELVDQPVALSGTVDDDPQKLTQGLRITVAVDRLLSNGLDRHFEMRVQATLYGGRAVNAGDQVLLTGRLTVPPSFEQFDYRTYLEDRGISAVLQGAQLVDQAAGSPDPLHAGLFWLRHALVNAVERGLPEPQAALLLGVVFGYRTSLASDLQQQMIASGLIHIVVISGLKVSLLARLVQRGLSQWIPGAAPWLALGAMLVYALLAGASAAALRAAAMGALVVVAGKLRRDTHVYTSMAFTAAAMLGLRPALAHDVSFDLSFAGTLGIARFTDPVAAHLRFLPGVLREPFSATVAAEAATWPLMLANFHQVSLVAPLANALVLPLLPVMMVIGGGGTLLAVVAPPAAFPLLQAAAAVASWFRLVIGLTSSLPAAALAMPYFPARWLTAACLLNAGLLGGLAFRSYLFKMRWLALPLGAALLSVVLLLLGPDGKVHVYALDVGTGSAVLVRTGTGEQLLIDGGQDPNLLAQALGRALPPTARQINDWLITGGRLAQIGAAPAVLQRYRVDRMLVDDPDPWTPSLRNLVDAAQADGVPVATATGLTLDGVLLTTGSDGRTLVLQSGSAVLLVMAPDSEVAGEAVPIIFTSGGPPDWADAPPPLAVIEVARNSRAGLPARDLLLGLNGAKILRTDQVGSVELVPSAQGFEPVYN